MLIHPVFPNTLSLNPLFLNPLSLTPLSLIPLSLKPLALDPLPLTKRTEVVFARLHTAIYTYQATSEFGILDQLVHLQCE